MNMVTKTAYLTHRVEPAYRSHRLESGVEKLALILPTNSLKGNTF